MAITIELKNKAAAKLELYKQVATHAEKHNCVAYGAFLWDSWFKLVEEDVITTSELELNAVKRDWNSFLNAGQSIIVMRVSPDGTLV